MKWDNKSRRHGVLLTMIIFCLALLIQAGAARPALADGQCEDRAWLNAPPVKHLAKVPSGAPQYIPYTVALARDYAILGWQKKGTSTYYFALGTMVNGSSGRQEIDWKIDEAYVLESPGAYFAPSIAINDKGSVVIAIQSSLSSFGYMACQVDSYTHLMQCGTYFKNMFEGTVPSLALNVSDSGAEYAVLTYEHLSTLYYRMGTILPDRGPMVSWNNPHVYTKGLASNFAMNKLGDVASVHVDLSNKNYFLRIGKLDSGIGEIHFGESLKLESITWFPTVALSEKNIIVIHWQEIPTGFCAKYQYGTFDSYAGTVSWQDGMHQLGGDYTDSPWVAVNNQGDVLMTYKNIGEKYVDDIYGGLGKMGYGYACPWPFVKTAPVSQYTGTAAICGGEVTMEGDAPVTARGVCWSNNRNPTINDSHTSDSTSFGTYTSLISGLTPNTGYFVRAYATNANGTAYGDNVQFKSGQGSP